MRDPQYVLWLLETKHGAWREDVGNVEMAEAIARQNVVGNPTGSAPRLEILNQTFLECGEKGRSMYGRVDVVMPHVRCFNAVNHPPAGEWRRDSVGRCLPQESHTYQGNLAHPRRAAPDPGPSLWHRVFHDPELCKETLA